MPWQRAVWDFTTLPLGGFFFFYNRIAGIPISHMFVSSLYRFSNDVFLLPLEGVASFY
ncbi:MAG: hypothetical protein K9G11_01530 [Rickettsiaceae bacterium]|nr:hypothetical protein [Rickettsiaceae bacterium]